MNFLELAKSRFAVRDYDQRPVEEEKLQRILEAGQVAPTAKNQQPQMVYVLKSPEALERIRALTRCAYNAPVVFMMAYDRTLDWTNPMEPGVSSGQQDVSIVSTHMMLQACELGLSSCWVDFFAPSELKRAFHLPENMQVVHLLLLGYAAPSAGAAPSHAQSKPLSSITTYL